MQIIHFQLFFSAHPVFQQLFIWLLPMKQGSCTKDQMTNSIVMKDINLQLHMAEFFLHCQVIWWVLAFLFLTLKQLCHSFSFILFSNVFHYKCNISICNWSKTMDDSSALLITMAWGFSIQNIFHIPRVKINGMVWNHMHWVTCWMKLMDETDETYF